MPSTSDHFTPALSNPSFNLLTGMPQSIKMLLPFPVTNTELPELDDDNVVTLRLIF